MLGARAYRRHVIAPALALVRTGRGFLPMTLLSSHALSYSLARSRDQLLLTARAVLRVC
eukprot:SAG22_NODE_8339_length_663_cov_0.913121_1_plen_58_part_10